MSTDAFLALSENATLKLTLFMKYSFNNPKQNVVWFDCNSLINPYPTALPYGNGMVLHFYQQQERSTTKTVHKVINKGLKTYV